METSAMLSPLRFGNYLCKHPLPAEPSEPWMPPTPEPNFRIDDLLDFSNGELCDESDEEVCEELEETNLNVGYGTIDLKVGRCVAEEESQQQQATTSGLCLPSDELADQLEWLSAFNEDSSFSGDRHLASLVSSGCLGGSKDDEKPAASVHDDTFQSPSPNSVLEPSSVFHVGAYSHPPSTNYCNSTQHGLSRARSKRARAGTRIWSLDSLMPTLFDTRHTGAGAQESPVFFGSPRVSHLSVVPAKKAKKPAFLFKPMLEVPARRCSHCLVTKTPQWRAGPMGPKTLCNACGVRYKSGRLVPEYRPAGSPTFVSEVHSNSHKRILEMRRMKEREEEHVPLHKDEEEEESDSFSQNEFCKEYEREDMSTLNSSSQDLNGITCSEKDDAMGPICSEKDDAMGSFCSEKDDATGSTCHERDELTG